MLRASLLILISFFLLGWGIIPHGGGVGEPPDVMLAMNFDSGSCVDNQGGSWIATEANSGNCDGTSINGSRFSGDVNAANSAQIQDLDGATEQSSGFVTADYLWISVANSSANVDDTFSMRSDAGTVSCSVRFLTAGGVRAVAADGSTGGSFVIADSTLYYMRLRYDIDNDDCILLTSTSNWGGSDVGASTANGAAGVNVGGWQMNQSASENLFDSSIDEIRICDGDYGTTAGACSNS